MTRDMISGCMATPRSAFLFFCSGAEHIRLDVAFGCCSVVQILGRMPFTVGNWILAGQFGLAVSRVLAPMQSPPCCPVSLFPSCLRVQEALSISAVSSNSITGTVCMQGVGGSCSAAESKLQCRSLHPQEPAVFFAVVDAFLAGRSPDRLRPLVALGSACSLGLDIAARLTPMLVLPAIVLRLCCPEVSEYS